MSQDLIIGAANGKVTIEITGQPAIAVSPERALELAGELVIYAGTAATQPQTIAPPPSNDQSSAANDQT